MRGCWISLGMIAACCGVLADSAVAAGKPIVTNKSRFRIPFKFDAAAMQKMDARELQLYVSRDQGANWELGQVIAPQTGRFDFQAPADGEYWFSVKTLDGAGQLHPAGRTFEPGLMVVVDTRQPVLDLTLESLGGGKVQLRWKSDDPNLDPTSLRLEFIQPGTPNWQQVSIIPRGSGQTSWAVPESGVVAVRGTIADLAGNSGATQKQLTVDATGEAIRRTPPGVRAPIAEGDAPPNQNLGQTTSTDAPGRVRLDSESASPKQYASLPTGRGMREGTVPPPTTSGKPVMTPLVSDWPGLRPEVARDRWESDPLSAADDSPRRSPGLTKVINTRKFNIGYACDDVGPSGVGAVELYVTEDGGRKWWRYGEDADRTSPFEVDVPRDGDYGFAIRVRSGAGLGVEPPASGDAPAIVVAVDQTPPAIEQFTVQPGLGAQAGQLVIQWRTGTETHPSTAPVSLYYATSSTGPWLPIAEGRPDSSEYEWSIASGITSPIFVRLVVEDEAGNASRAETPQAVVIDLSRPRARIVDVVAPTPRAN